MGSHQIGKDNSCAPTHSCIAVYEHVCDMAVLLDELQTILEVLHD